MNRTGPSPFEARRRRPIVRAVLGSALLAVAAGGCAPVEQGNGEGDATPPAVPQEIRDALDRAARTYPHPLGGAKWASFHRLEGTEHAVYQVRGTNARGNIVELEVTGAGRVIEVEEHGVPVGEVPTPVLDAVKSRVPGFVPEKVEAIYQTENPRPVAYGFEGKDAAGKKVEVYVSADGKTFLN